MKAETIIRYSKKHANFSTFWGDTPPYYSNSSSCYFPAHSNILLLFSIWRLDDKI